MYIEFLWYRRSQKNGKQALKNDLRDELMKELAGRIINITPKDED
jgi:hypothetical protein